MRDRSDTPSAREWPVTWAAAQDDQLARMMAATPAQRLAWLEEALALAVACGALPTTSMDNEAVHVEAHSEHGS